MAARVAGSGTEGAEQALRGAASHPWLEGLTRFGYAVRGMLYIVIGALAVGVAAGVGGETTNQVGAVALVGSQPFGRALLVLVAAGLLGYGLWGLIRALLDPLGRGADAKGLAQRAGYLASGVTYLLLVIPTVRMLLQGVPQEGAGATGGAPAWTAWLMAQPAGPWLVGLAGALLVATGAGQLYEAYGAAFARDFDPARMGATERRWAERFGRAGYAARGVVFGLLGFFLLQAAISSEAARAQGLDGALRTLAQQPYGPWLLGLTALGLVAFGAFSLLCARWIRVGQRG